MHHRNRHRAFQISTDWWSVLKTFYKKQKPKIIHYRNYKNFENVNFRQNLKKKYWSLMLQMLHYQILITLYYLFLARRVTRGGEEGRSTLPFFKESALIWGEKCPNVCCRLNLYLSALIFRNLPCPEKFLVTRLLTSTLQKKKKKEIYAFKQLQFYD